MVSLKNRKIGPSLEALDTIKEFKIMWLSSRGLVSDLDEAVQITLADGQNPEEIRAIVVAVGESGYNEAV